MDSNSNARRHLCITSGFDELFILRLSTEELPGFYEKMKSEIRGRVKMEEK